MKIRRLKCDGVTVKVITQEGVDLQCDLFGMQNDYYPIEALLEAVKDHDISEYGGGIAISELHCNYEPLWRGLICENKVLVNNMLVTRETDTPKDLSKLLKGCEEPWVEWIIGDSKHYALLIDICGQMPVKFYWAVVRFDKE